MTPDTLNNGIVGRHLYADNKGQPGLFVRTPDTAKLP